MIPNYFVPRKPVQLPLFLAAVALSLILISAGCATQSAPPTLKMPQIPPPRAISPPASSQATVPIPSPSLRFPWLAIHSFYPPHARRIIPYPARRIPKLAKTPEAWFPSTDECTSPDGEWTLYHDGRQRGDQIDYIVFARRRDTGNVVPVLKTQRVMHVLWSSDSSRVAVTVLAGENRSYVFILHPEGPTLSEAISAEDALHDYFSLVQIRAPQFMMALRWTEYGDLVIRARGQEALPPKRFFGYEVLVDTNRLLQLTAVQFLRGYLQSADEAGSDN